MTKSQVFFFLWVEAISLILLESRTQREKHPKLHGDKRLFPSSPKSRVGTTWGGAAGGDLEPQSSPAGSRPAGAESNGKAGPSLHVRTAEGRLPGKTCPCHPHSCTGQGAHISQRLGHGHIPDWEAAGVEAGDTIMWAESVAAGRRWGLGGPHRPNPEVTREGPKRG